MAEKTKDVKDDQYLIDDESTEFLIDDTKEATYKPNEKKSKKKKGLPGKPLKPIRHRQE